MANPENESKKPEAEPVKDLEELSDEDLDEAAGGRCACATCRSCDHGGSPCRTCGGGCCMTGTGTTHEANIKGELGDVELTPIKSTDAKK